MEAGRVVSLPPLAFFELCLKAGRVVSLRQNTDEVDSQSIQSRLIVDSKSTHSRFKRGLGRFKSGLFRCHKTRIKRFKNGSKADQSSSKATQMRT